MKTQLKTQPAEKAAEGSLEGGVADQCCRPNTGSCGCDGHFCYSSFFLTASGGKVWFCTPFTPHMRTCICWIHGQNWEGWSQGNSLLINIRIKYSRTARGSTTYTSSNGSKLAISSHSCQHIVLLNFSSIAVELTHGVMLISGVSYSDSTPLSISRGFHLSPYMLLQDYLLTPCVVKILIFGNMVFGNGISLG